MMPKCFLAMCGVCEFIDRGNALSLRVLCFTNLHDLNHSVLVKGVSMRYGYSALPILISFPIRKVEIYLKCVDNMKGTAWKVSFARKVYNFIHPRLFKCVLVIYFPLVFTFRFWSRLFYVANECFLVNQIAFRQDLCYLC